MMSALEFVQQMNFCVEVWEEAARQMRADAQMCKARGQIRSNEKQLLNLEGASVYEHCAGVIKGLLSKMEIPKCEHPRTKQQGDCVACEVCGKILIP